MLGNNFATTEAPIAEMSMRIAGAGKQIGLTEPQVLGLATALSSVGIQAQMGGSAISKALIKMEVAASTGGDELKDFARVTSMTEKQFVEAWRKDPIQVFQKFIESLGERYNIREIAYDRCNATMMVQTLEDDGLTMVPFGQGFRDMSPPTKELMRIVLERKLNHGGHPVLRWNMDNAFVRTDPAGNLKIDKEKSTEKVDGAVALVMALDRALKNANTGASVYDDRGFLII